MVDTKKLKAAVIAKGLTFTEAAQQAGMTRRMWYDRMAAGKFSSDEMYRLIKGLDLSDPAAIFFADEVT